MPLPNGAPLALLVNSNAVQSRPKRAMIVRMSAETLDALEAFPAHPPLSIDFGGNPGIYISDTFFPMRPLKESSPHELYLRAASAAKPMAPLKLHANVIGKFMVERQLGEKVTDKVRQQTMVAKQQHMERQAILLDQPPIPVPGAKNAKRKIPSGKTPASVHLRVPSSSTAASRRVSPLPQNTPSSKASADVRRRLVRFLAISPRLADDAVKMVGGANISDSARDDLLTLLADVAEQRAPVKKGDKSPRPWALKPQTWTEVRPFEWPKLTEPERVAMARQARMVFKALKIPESDPAWENVRYRPAAPTVPTSIPAPPPMAATSNSRSSGSAQAETKRSAISSKDARLKSKQDAPRAKGDIQMKDESSKATVARVNAIKRAEIDRPSTPSDSGSSTKTAASRRLPGSGYQAKKTPLLSTAVTEKSGTPAAPKQSLSASLPQKPLLAVPPAGGTHARKTIPIVPPKPMKKEDESDRERDIEEKEREREEMEQVKRQRERDRISKERAAGSAVPASKRKAAAQDAEEYLDASIKASLSKRRKLDDGPSVASSSKAWDVGSPGPKKLARDPSPVPRLKMKKDRSPQASASHEDRRTSSGSTHKSERPTKTSGSVKPRRRSPIYTSSSEDEGEIPQPRKRNLSPPPVSDRSNSSDQPPAERGARHHRTTRTAYPPATDHPALRALYQSQYSSYLGTFSQIVAQKRAIRAMLNGDSEAEVDVMGPDDLTKLSMEHQSHQTELENILDIYTKGTIVGVPASD
ncbi:hypothetical protein HD554DRAFT_2187682 [Boletus coccyginus]|nr:hypothetical protein HD554DRAFT_2187682 [Boletus coccyginus]